jgi:Undecaprenyl-phosphate galactose phosphotransferase WbaP
MSSRIEAKSVSIRANPARSRSHRQVLHVFIYTDLLALVSAAVLGLAISRMVGDPSSLGEAGLAYAAALACVFAFRSIGHYRARQALCDQIRPVLQTLGLAFLIVSTSRMALGEAGIDWGSVVQWALSPALILILRLGAREALKAENSWYEPVILIGPTEDADQDTWLIKANDGHGLTVDQSVNIADFARLDDAALGARLRALPDRPIFLAPDASYQILAARIASRLSARGAEFYYKPHIGRIPSEKLDLLDAPPAEGLVLRIGDSLNRPVAQWTKRAFDLLVASLALVLLSPVLLIIAALIRRDGGPALFVQPRAGKGGQPFGCYKFRTMAVDAEARLEAILADDPNKRAQWDAYQKLDDDPRITPVGRLLRATSLDELAQLFNVIKGDMSLIGPRPMLMDQMSIYGTSLDAYVRMRPGITGLWQVNGRNATTFEERARLDDWYARNWSLWRDVVILVRTVREVLFTNGR